MKKTTLIGLCLFSILFLMAALVFVSRNNSQANQFQKIGEFSTNVDQSLIDKGVTFVKDYYINYVKTEDNKIDIAKTNANYKCTYKNTAKDQKYLYINLSCWGDALNKAGEVSNIPLTGFGDNLTRLEYSYENGVYKIIEMNQPPANSLYPDVFPQEYLNSVQFTR